MSIQQPCFHTAPIPVTIQWPTIWPWADQDTSCFHQEDCSNWSILDCQLPAQPCGSCGITSWPYLQVSWWLRRNCGRGLCPPQREIGGALVLVQVRRQMVHPAAFLIRNYLENLSEKVLFWEGRTNILEGCVSLHERGDPRLLRRPGHRRKHKRDNLLILWTQTLSDDGILCSGHSVSRVPWFQPMLDPQVRSVSIYQYTKPHFQLEYGHQSWELSIQYSNVYAIWWF